MRKIVKDFVEKKMNVRKLILWAFLVLFLSIVIAFLASACFSMARAIWALSDYTVENPQAVLGAAS